MNTPKSTLCLLKSAPKWLAVFVSILFTGILSSGELKAQSEYDSSKTYQVIKNDGTEYIGKIIKSDEREILLQTTTIGKI